ncbi:trypsin-like cysteine/serine peptidase domain-containing protein [Amylocarpus encephaloides]|uniref:Trypsin-like cysteine/serine peptidase domain-containing protein n=1 Tax=Amylocarpus encephaloides TaxID=45428 RepID=A0A9P7YB31_9HELO|nr:trypsin-like cysteine/serine peptidase domain-containing protein [Amylocarpus encephaloides]
MPAPRRGLRSSSTPGDSSSQKSKQETDFAPSSYSSNPISFTASASSSSSPEQILILSPHTKLPGLNPKELTLLRKKQQKLLSSHTTVLSNVPSNPRPLEMALASTLIFAQQEAGTAFLIHPQGWLLTCSHCFGDSPEEYEEDSKMRWLLFYTGIAVQVECRFWDPKRDLALLKVIAIEADSPQLGKMPQFPYLKLSELTTPKQIARLPILCIGQPGAGDLESSNPNAKTTYDLFEISTGTLKGMVTNVDPQDCSEIGTLKHDAWTYWGHSGAPLIDEREGGLVGVHSSWDEETAMRHGIPGVTVREFLTAYGGLFGDVEGGSQENSIVVD